MINEEEIAWLKIYYPSLVVNNDRTEVEGNLTSSAVYDKKREIFTPLTLSGQMSAGEMLTGSYGISIKKSKYLPQLRIGDKEIELNLDRHFYSNGVACLCGPVESFDFLNNEYSFPRYLETLVIPFLYGQIYYDLHNKKWPWETYAHGAAGIFDSYAKNKKTLKHIEACLVQLKNCGDWERIRNILLGVEKIRENSACLCTGSKKIRECHPHSWFTMISFKGDIKKYGIQLN